LGWAAWERPRWSRSVVGTLEASGVSSRPHADGLACAVWPQLATSAVWRKVPGAGAKLSARSGLIACERRLIGPRRPPVSWGSGCSTTCLPRRGAFGLQVRRKVGARGHARKQGAPDGVGGGREGDLGGFVLLGGAGAQTVAPGPGLLADGCGQVQDRPPAPGRTLPADPEPGVGGSGLAAGGSSPAAGHTFDHSAHRPVEPTKATNPAAATTPTPRSWVSLAPWVPASSSQTAAASSQSVLRRRLPCCLPTAATCAGFSTRTTSSSRSSR
jgi:hypothetical protein